MCILPFSEALLHRLDNLKSCPPSLRLLLLFRLCKEKKRLIAGYRLDGYKSPLFCSSVGMVLVVSVFELSQ